MNVTKPRMIDRYQVCALDEEGQPLFLAVDALTGMIRPTALIPERGYPEFVAHAMIEHVKSRNSRLDWVIIRD